jgi:hypothetical protein
MKRESSVKSFFEANSPTILSCIAGIGTVLTSIFAVKATPKATRLLETARADAQKELTKTEIIKAVWKAYIPTASIAFSTIICIFSANALNQKQQAALTSAYVLLDGAFKEYKNKVSGLLGNDVDNLVERAIAIDHENDEPYPWNEPQTFYEEHLGKFFERTMEEVFLAEYHFNRNFILRGSATLNEFYDFLKLPRTELGEQLGWSAMAGAIAYDYYWVDFTHRKFKMDDGLECTSIDFPFEPTRDFMDY